MSRQTVREHRSVRKFKCLTCGTPKGKKCKTVWGNDTSPHMNRLYSLRRLEEEESALNGTSTEGMTLQEPDPPGV